MDRRTTTAVLLIIAIWYGWLLLNPPDPTEEGQDVSADVPAQVEPVAAVPSDVGSAAPAADGPEELIDVTLCRAQAQVSTRDGGLRKVDLLDHKAHFDVMPFYAWVMTGFDGPWKQYGDPPGQEEVLSSGAAGMTAGAGSLDQAPPRVEVVRSTASSLVTRGVTPQGLEIVRELTSVPGEPCRVEATVTWTNTSSQAFTGGLWVGMHDQLPEDSGRYDAAMRPRAYVDGGIERRDDLTDLAAPEAVQGPVSWFGLADAYFGTLVVPSAPADGVLWFSPIQQPGGALAYGEHYVLSAPVPAGGAVSRAFTLYMGPKRSSELSAIDPTLAEAVDLGFFAALGWPLLWLLDKIHGLVGNWGLAIIGLTFLVKLLFYPLTQKSFESTQAMSSIQPYLAEIREKYKDNPEELNRRTMAAFSEHGVNPLGGCLPMLVQMPVWFALYSVLLSSVELYHTEFLYLKDLSAPDPYMVMPALAVVLMVVQQQFMPRGQMDPAQERMMRLMPIVFGIFFFSFPSGLVIYIFVNMVLSILQQWYIKRTYSPPQPKTA